MRFAKPPILIADQIAQLQSRGMNIPDSAAATHYLSHISYYRLTAYWLPFESDHAAHQFHAGTTFNGALNLYRFDRELRLILMDAIERIEISIRSRWMDVMVQAHGAHAHLDAALFTTKTDRNGNAIWSHEKAIAALKLGCAKSRETFIVHLRQKYDEDLPPLWAICELMTFGEFSKWFANTQSSALRNQVSRAYQLDESILVSFLHHLSVVRNLCAHHARVWNREFTFTWKLPKRLPAPLVENLRHIERSRLYNTLVMLGFLMDIISPNSVWKARVLALIAKFRIDVNSMGFPCEYRDYPLWQEKKPAAFSQEEVLA